MVIIKLFFSFCIPQAMAIFVSQILTLLMNRTRLLLLKFFFFLVIKKLKTHAITINYIFRAVFFAQQLSRFRKKLFIKSF